MESSYVDNAQNRRLGRVGMPRGSMPESRRSGGAVENIQTKAQNYDSKKTLNVSTYVDNPKNRTLGRVGMPKGSMPVSKVSGQTGRESTSREAKGANGYHQQGVTTYADNNQNRKLDRVGMPKGSMPVSKTDVKTRRESNSRESPDYSGFHQKAIHVETYVDNYQNRKFGRAGMPKGTMPVSKADDKTRRESNSREATRYKDFHQKGVHKETYVDNYQNRNLDRAGMPKGSMPVSKADDKTKRESNSREATRYKDFHQKGVNKETYVDNYQNRNLDRVGMPKGSMPVSKADDKTRRESNSREATRYKDFHQKGVHKERYVDNYQNRKLDRVGMPKGSMPVSKADDKTRRESNSREATRYKDFHQKGVHKERYVDNYQNRKLDRVGMPKGSMPVSKVSGSTERESDSTEATHIDGLKNKRLDTYVDNYQNRRLGRVGMPRGSMPESKVDSQTKRIFDNDEATGTRSFKEQYFDTYDDNYQNTKLVQGCFPVDNMYSFENVSNGMTEESRKLYADNTVNRNPNGDNANINFSDILFSRRNENNYNPQARKAEPRSTYHSFDAEFSDGNKQHETFVKAISEYDSAGRNDSETYPSDTNYRNETFSRSTDSVQTTSNNGDSPIFTREPKVYTDRPLNRLLGRVGLPLGTAVFSPQKKKYKGRKIQRNNYVKKTNQSGQPGKHVPIEQRTPQAEKIQEVLNRLEVDDEFNEWTFQQTATNGELGGFGYFDSDGQRVEVFDQALYQYNKRQAERSWRMNIEGKEAPKTQQGILKRYRGKRIAYSEIQFLKIVGKGGFGSVYLAQWNDTVVAVKKIQEEKISQSRVDDFEREILKFCNLEHENIVTFIGACLEKSNPCIIMEYMHMTVYDALFIRNDVVFSEAEQDIVIEQVCQGMKYLHSKRIAHCDLKTSNILLNYIENAICEVKITDFGLSMVAHDLTVSSVELVHNIGTIKYSSPEMLRGEILSAKDMMKADVYSLAMIFLEVLFVEEPFPEYGYLQMKTEVGQKGETPQIPDDPPIDVRVNNLMYQCWSYEPMDRPSMSKICEIVSEVTLIIKENVDTI